MIQISEYQRRRGREFSNNPKKQSHPNTQSMKAKQWKSVGKPPQNLPEHRDWACMTRVLNVLGSV
jgi:hypothetical protein